MKKRQNYVLALFFVIAVFFLLLSCKTKMVYVPVESVITEYKEKYLRDSIHHYDSILVREKGDTVFLEKYKYIYRDKLKTDTVCKVDSIRIPYPVMEYKEINKIHTWQIVLMVLGGILIGYVGYRLFRFFNRKF